MNIFIDIETIPDQSPTAKIDIMENIKHPAQIKKQETIDAWHNGAGKYAGEKEKAIEEKYLKTSFDGGYGQICCVCFIVDGEKHTITATGRDKDLLVEFWGIVRSKTLTPKFIAHNAKFDLPFLYHRSVVNGVNPLVYFAPLGRHGNNHFCTMEAWAGYNGSISLDKLAKILKVGKKTEGIDGSQVWGEFQKRNIKKIADYCMDDVDLTRKIYNKINFIK